MFNSRVLVAAVALAGFGLVGCGSGDSVDADDPLVGAIADQILVEEQGDETGGVFGGDSATAECFSGEIVGAIGTDRLNELGFTTDSIPEELQADWSEDEIDILVDSLDGCVDIEAITKTALLADVSEQDQNCILGEIGNDFFLTVVRAGFAAGADDAASQAALERAYAPLIAAYETCGVSLFGDAAPSAMQDSPEAVVYAYHAGADAKDAAAMFALISPDRREGVTVADWTGCMSERLADIAGAELEFAHRGTSAVDGSTFVEAQITLTEEGQGAVPSDDTETLTVSVVMEVTETDGVWWVVGSDNDFLDSFSCL